MPPKKKLSSLKQFEEEIIGKEASQLLKKPKKLKSSEMPHFTVPNKNAIMQIDVLYFPETTSAYKYCLVCCDVATNKCGAEPMRDKSSDTCLAALKIILKRKDVALPALLMCDGGSEWKSNFAKYMKDNGVGIQIATYHRQLLPIDHICNILAHYLGGAMLGKEIETGETNKTEWKKHLSKLIKVLNDNYTKEPVDETKLNPIPNEKGNLLDIGTKVRILLNHPINIVNGSKLHGKWRAGDIRWSPEIYTIYAVHINPNQRVLYQVKDDDDNELYNVAFVREHLQLV
eukprot:gene3463-3692_t